MGSTALGDQRYSDVPAGASVVGGPAPSPAMSDIPPGAQVISSPARPGWMPRSLQPEQLSPRPGVPSEVGRQAQEKVATTPLLPEAWQAKTEREAAAISEKEDPFGAVIADLAVVGARMGRGFSTPQNLSIMAGTMALGPVGAIRGLVEAGFTWQMATDAYRAWNQGLELYRAGKIREGRQMMLSAPITAGLAILAGKGAGKEALGILRNLHPAPTLEPTWQAQIADPAMGMARERGFLRIGKLSPEQVQDMAEGYWKLLTSSAQRILIARELGQPVPKGDDLLLNIRRTAADLVAHGIDIRDLAKDPLFARYDRDGALTNAIETVTQYATEQSMAGRKGLAGMHADVTAGRVVETGADRLRQVTSELKDLVGAGHRVDDKDASGRPTPQADQLRDLLTEYSILQPQAAEARPPDIEAKLEEAKPAMLPPAPPNPSPEARARDQAVDEDHARVVAQRTQTEAELRRLQAQTATKAFQRSASKNQAVVMDRIAWLQRELERLKGAEDDLTGAMRMSLFGLDLLMKPFQRLYDLDIAPLLREKRVTFPEGLRDLKHAIAPRAGADERVLAGLGKMLGRRERAGAELALRTEHMRNLFNTLSRAEQIHFIDSYKLGLKQRTPELDNIADFIRDTDERTYRTLAEALAESIDDKDFQRMWASMSEEEKRDLLHRIGTFKADPDLESVSALQEFIQKMLTWKQNHYEVLWKLKPKSDSEIVAGTDPRELYISGKRPLRPHGHYKQSTLDTMSEGLGREGEPVSYNPMEMFEIAQAKRWRDITALRMWTEAKQIGMRVFVRDGDMSPPGWGKIPDRMADVYRPITSERGFEGAVHTGSWYMHPDYARMLTNYLSKDWIRSKGWGRGLMAFKNNLTGFRLGWSPFHAGTETMLAFGRKGGMGLQQVGMAIRYGDMKLARAGARDFITAWNAPWEFTKLGGDIIRYIKDKDQFLTELRGHQFALRFPEFDRMLDVMFQSGIKLEMHQDERLKMLEGLKQAYANDNPFGMAWRSPMALNQFVMRPLLNEFIPKLKLGVMARDYAIHLRDYEEDLAAGRITEAELGRRAWNSTENLFGQVNWDKFWWNNTLKSSSQLVFRALQWFAGYGRFGYDAFHGQYRSVLDSAEHFYNIVNGPQFDVPPSTRVIPRLDPDFATLLSLATVLVQVSALMNYVYTRRHPENWLDMIVPRTGKKDANGRDERVMLPGPWKDVISLWFHGPTAYGRSKLSDPINVILEIINNSDFQNNLVYNPDDPLVKKVWQGVEHVGLPIGFSTARREYQLGGGIGSMIAGGMGMTPAPPTFNYTKGEQAAYDLVKRGARRRTPEALEELSGYTRRRALGQLTTQEKLQEARRQREPYILRQLRLATEGPQAASYDEIKHVYDVASPTERKQLYRLMMTEYKKALRRGKQVPAP